MAAHRLIVTCNERRPVDLDHVGRVLDGIASVTALDLPHRDFEPHEANRFVETAGDASAILLRPGRLPGPVIRRLPKLRVIGLFGVGLNQVDVEACTAQGVCVVNAPGGNSTAVAEYAFGLLLALQRRIVPADALVRQGRWAEAVTTGWELSGKTLGIIGLGQIGGRVARIAQGFGMRTIGYDPHVTVTRLAELGVEGRSLDDLLGEADIVTLHSPLTAETEKLIDARRIALMPRHAVLVNTARGGLVDEDALVDALRSGRIAGAAIDAFAVEPLPAGSPFATLTNVVVSPHQAAQSYDSRPPMTEMLAQDFRRVLTGSVPVNLGNPDVLAVLAAKGRPLASPAE